MMIDEQMSRKMAENTDLQGLTDALVKAEQSNQDARERHSCARSEEVDASNASRAAERQRDVIADAISIKIGRVPK